MSKNLQEYLDKHKDCEVYKGQDHPDEPKEVNPMEVRRPHRATASEPLAERPPAPRALPRADCRPCALLNAGQMVLTEEGEKDFYYAARNSTQPLHIPSPQARGDFPAPERFETVGSVGKGGGMSGAGMVIPGAGSLTGRSGMSGAGSLVGSLTSTAAPLEIPQRESAMGIGAGGSVEVGSMGSLGGMSWGTPPACDSLDASPVGLGDGVAAATGVLHGSPPIGGGGRGMPMAMPGAGAGEMAMGRGVGAGAGGGFMMASPPVGMSMGGMSVGSVGRAGGLAGMDLPAEGQIDETHDVDETAAMEEPDDMLMESSGTPQGMDL